MTNYQEEKVKLTNTQIKKLKSATKNQTRTILRVNKKNSRWSIAVWIISNNKQTTKIRNAFANNMSTDIKLSKAQISKIIQSGGSFGS